MLFYGQAAREPPLQPFLPFFLSFSTVTLNFRRVSDFRLKSSNPSSFPPFFPSFAYYYYLLLTLARPPNIIYYSVCQWLFREKQVHARNHNFQVAQLTFISDFFSGSRDQVSQSFFCLEKQRLWTVDFSQENKLLLLPLQSKISNFQTNKLQSILYTYKVYSEESRSRQYSSSLQFI